MPGFGWARPPTTAEGLLAVFVRDYLYRGRHRRPTGRATGGLGTAAAAGALALAAPVVLPGTAGATEGATADTLRAIAGCESGSGPRSPGDPDVTGYSGRHYGLFQFDLPTWRSVGGVGNPARASVAEQYRRASILLDRRGTQPWDASKHCWRGHVSAVRPSQPVVSTPTLRGAEVRTVQGRTARSVDTTGSKVPDGYRVQRGDTLGRLATRYGTSVRSIASANRIANPDRIYVGQRLV